MLALASTAQAAMVAHYDFEDNGTTGTLQGGASITASGKYGKGVDLDGTGYVDGGHDSSYLVTQGTIMAWVNFDFQNPGPDAHDMQIAIVPAGDTWSDPWYGLSTWIHPSGSNSIAQANSSGAGSAFQTDTSKGGVTDDTWHHVAAAYDGNDLKHYADGNLIDTVSQTGSVTYTGTPTSPSEPTTRRIQVSFSME